MAEFTELHRFHRPEPQPQSQQQTQRPSSETSRRVHHQEQHEDIFYQQNSFPFDLESDNPNSSFFIPDDYTNSSNFGYDFSADAGNWVCEYADSMADRECCCCGEEEDNEPMNFITDLFEHREARVLDDTNWEFDSGQPDDSGTEFGFGPGLRSDALRVGVVGADSESDYREFEVNSGFAIHDEDNNYDIFGVNGYHISDSENEREELQRPEVNQRIQFDERENLNSVVDRIGEIMVTSDVLSDTENLFLEVQDEVDDEEEEDDDDDDDDEDEGDVNADWEVLLQNLEEINNGAGVPGFDLPDDYIITTEQVLENENAVKFGHPAAKSVVENLPSTALTVDEVRQNNGAVVCAVCKEDVAAGEKMTRMPCFHLYHGDCILPWLKIRNTCPVCRYELPTDDADYEKRRRERGGSGVAGRLVDILRFI